MRKILILLLVIGFLLGTFPVAEVVCEEGSLQTIGFTTDEGPGSLGDPAPCGQGGSGTGGGCPG